jgi:hypothetical protein
LIPGIFDAVDVVATTSDELAAVIDPSMLEPGLDQSKPVIFAYSDLAAFFILDRILI